MDTKAQPRISFHKHTR
jgi:hypothetical protein